MTSPNFSHSSSSEDSPAIVIDNGSGVCKCGFAGDDIPRSRFPNIVGHPLHGDTTSKSGRSAAKESCRFVGNSAVLEGERESVSALSLKHPIEHGIVTNWDDMETIWQDVFQNQLKVPPEEHPVLLTEAPLNPKANRERMAQVMFEKFGVPALYVAVDAILILFSAAGRVSGVVVQCGDGVSSAVPVWEGYAIEHAIQRVDLAGREVTDYLMRSLAKRGYAFSTSVDRERVRVMKEHLCYVSRSFTTEMTSSSEETDYQLPDGEVIHLGKERFTCTEALFAPSLIGLRHSGIHEITNAAVTNCETDTRRDFYMNIIASGGSTLLNNFTERLSDEMKNFVPPSRRVKIVAPPERSLSAWIGGSVLASLSSFEQMWLPRRLYEECGPFAVHRHQYREAM